MPLRSTSSLRDQVTDHLENHRSALDHFELVQLECPKEFSIKSAQVYIMQWAQVNNYLIRTSRNQRVITIQRILIRSLTPQEPSPPLTPPVPYLELWAEYCLNNQLPLEDVMAAIGGQTPNFLPTSVEGLSLIRQVKGT